MKNKIQNILKNEKKYDENEKSEDIIKRMIDEKKE